MNPLVYGKENHNRCTKLCINLCYLLRQGHAQILTRHFIASHLQEMHGMILQIVMGAYSNRLVACRPLKYGTSKWTKKKRQMHNFIYLSEGILHPTYGEVTYTLASIHS